MELKVTKPDSEDSDLALDLAKELALQHTERLRLAQTSERFLTAITFFENALSRAKAQIIIAQKTMEIMRKENRHDR